MRWMAVLVLVAACGSDSQADKDKAHARDACVHFRNIAGDYSSGVILRSELRGKLIEVRSKSEISTAEVYDAATKMVAAATSGDDLLLSETIKVMDTACRGTGN
jgi:hypothetical protein